MKLDNKLTAVIGLGYVGLPLALEFCISDQKIIGLDIDELKIESLNKGISYISYIEGNDIKHFIDLGILKVTSDFSFLCSVNNIIIAVPTPLKKHREPDLSFIENSVKAIVRYLQKGQLIVLESTTYPGTTRDVIMPLVESAGFIIGEDVFLAYSPERVDPNNKNFKASDIPKVIGGITEQCRVRAEKLYKTVFKKVVTVSSVEIAEASKLFENIFRAVNIALVNELKMLFDKMNLDIWEVIQAAETKPFGFMPFSPGPGLGGHCIPIDPFYLTWKAREYDFSTRFIELAGEINRHMPYYVVSKTAEALNELGMSLKDAKILVLGAAYKKNIDDIRESPAVKIITLFKDAGALVSYYDPYIPVIKGLRHYPNFMMQSVALSKEYLNDQDCVAIITDHDCIDYGFIFKNSRCIIDTRNVLKEIEPNSIKVFKA